MITKLMDELRNVVCEDNEVESVQISEDTTGIVVRIKQYGVWSDPIPLRKVFPLDKGEVLTLTKENSGSKSIFIYIFTSFIVGVAVGYAWRIIQLM